MFWLSLSLQLEWELAEARPAFSLHLAQWCTQGQEQCWINKISQNFLRSMFAYHPVDIQEIFETLEEEI